MRYKMYIFAAILLIAAIISFFPIAKMATDPARYARTIAALDEKKQTVMELTAASTASSAAITLIPGDVATPLADKLADISGYFVIVICALYLEKYMLTILGYVAFKILLPGACVIIALGLLQKRPSTRESLIRTGLKAALFGIALFLIVPASVKVSDMISATYQDSIDSTLEEARKSAEELKAEQEAAEKEEADAQGTESTESTESQGWWDSIVNGAKNIAGDAKNAAAGLLNEFQQTVNHLIEALAVMIVTSCLIPILVIVFFVWIIQTVLNMDISLWRPGRR